MPRKTFKVYHPDWLGSDYQVIDASYEQEAAEFYAQEYDAGGDYSVVGGSPITVEVENEEGQRSKFTVTGETIPRYNAQRTS